MTTIDINAKVAGLTTTKARTPRGALVWTLIALIITAAVSWIMLRDVIPWLRGPAPYPPEWDWPYVPLSWLEYGTWLHLAAFLLYPLIVLAVLHPTWIAWRSERQRRTVVLALAVLFFIGLQMALAHARKGNLLELVIFRVYAPPGNGYFMSAVRTEDIWNTLHHYAAAMPNFPHDRPRTHPPAIFMYYSAFNYLFERLVSFSDWFAPIARTWAPADRDWVKLQNPYIASAFFSGVTQWLLMAPVPLAFYAVLRRLQGKVSSYGDFALWGAMLLPLIGSVSSFYSHWDVNYLLLFALAWFFALRGQDRLHGEPSGRIVRWLDWLWSGLLLSLLTWLSFGNAVMCVLIGGHLLWRELVHTTREWPEVRQAASGTGAALACSLWRRHNFVLGALLMIVGVVTPWVIAWFSLQINYFEILQVGLQQHWIIVNNGRDFNIWRWMNLVDYSLWVGPGVVLLGIVGSIWLVAHMRRGELESNLAGLALIFWGVLMVLNFSGTARAEVGRLWIFLMPFPVLFALAYLRTYGLRAALMAMLAVTAWVMGYALRAV